MTHKALLYTKHGSARLRERGIRRGDIRRVLAVGDTMEQDGPLRKHAKRAEVDGRSLLVHYKETARGIHVITAYFEN